MVEFVEGCVGEARKDNAINWVMGWGGMWNVARGRRGGDAFLSKV
jgi:hypothetical protein